RTCLEPHVTRCADGSLDELADRSVRERRLPGVAASAEQDEIAGRGQFVEQTRLPDASFTLHEHSSTGITTTCKYRPELGHLLRSADERRRPTGGCRSRGDARR